MGFNAFFIPLLHLFALEESTHWQVLAWQLNILDTDTASAWSKLPSVWLGSGLSVEMSLFTFLKLLRSFLWHLISAGNVFWISKTSCCYIQYWNWTSVVTRTTCCMWKTLCQWLIVAIICAYWHGWMIAS